MTVIPGAVMDRLLGDLRAGRFVDRVQQIGPGVPDGGAQLRAAPRPGHAKNPALAQQPYFSGE